MPHSKEKRRQSPSQRHSTTFSDGTSTSASRATSQSHSAVLAPRVPGYRERNAIDDEIDEGSRKWGFHDSYASSPIISTPKSSTPVTSEIRRDEGHRGSPATQNTMPLDVGLLHKKLAQEQGKEMSKGGWAVGSEKRSGKRKLDSDGAQSQSPYMRPAAPSPDYGQYRATVPAGYSLYSVSPSGYDQYQYPHPPVSSGHQSRHQSPAQLDYSQHRPPTAPDHSQYLVPYGTSSKIASHSEREAKRHDRK